MKRLSVIVAVVALLCLGALAQASITIETVPVGDPGNAGEQSGAGNYNSPARICGSVSYTYNIGKYEVTAGQYTAFLNAVAATDTYGLYNTYMDTAVNSRGCNIKRAGASGSYTYGVASDWANRPVNYVSLWDACRFTNWLHNGQATGAQDASTTERGAYTLDGENGKDGRAIQRSSNWEWAVTTEDEWYKAAYYKGGNTNAGYWDYATKSDILPSNDLTNPDAGNNGNYMVNEDDYTIRGPYWRTEVGEFENSVSAYGTFDQFGNVWEWNESIVKQWYDNTNRGIRYFDAGARNSYVQPVSESDWLGFRVSAVAPVPEPSSFLILGSGILALAGMIRRKRNG